MPTRDIFNAATQQVEPAELSVDHNNEIIATFKAGSFLKFPAGLSQKDFDTHIELVQVHNEGQEVITPEAEAAKAKERAASLALIGGEDVAQAEVKEDN